MGNTSTDPPHQSPASRRTPPLLNQKIFVPYKIATLIETVAPANIPAEAVLERTELTPDEVHDPNTLTSIRQYLTACENIIAAGADLTVAFSVGSRLHLSAYGMYGYALICSPTMREFFDFAVRYHVLATPTLRLGWRLEGDLAIWEFHEVYSEVMSSELRTFLIHQQMLQTFTHVRDVAGLDNVPVRANFSVADARSRPDCERILGCPCHFDQPAHELHYPARLLERAPELGNRLTRVMLEETCDRLLGKYRMPSGITGEVYQLLLLAPNLFPSMQSIALKFGMTERTLRRRLSDEGRTYAEIVDDVRKTLAMEYLRTTRMSAEDIAWKVGFSDAANLRRAVRRWTGKKLNEIRRD